MAKLCEVSVLNGVLSVSPNMVKSSYGKEGFRAIDTNKTIAKNPTAKMIQLVGYNDAVLQEFPSDIAFKTLGTKCTNANKLLAGVPVESKSTRGSRTKLLCEVADGKLSITDGESIIASIDAKGLYITKNATKASGHKAMRIMAESLLGESSTIDTLTETVEGVILGKPKVKASLNGLEYVIESETIDAETKNAGVAGIASMINKSGKIELFGKLAEVKYAIVGKDASRIPEWIKLYRRMPEPTAKQVKHAVETMSGDRDPLEDVIDKLKK